MLHISTKTHNLEKNNYQEYSQLYAYESLDTSIAIILKYC